MQKLFSNSSEEISGSIVKNTGRALLVEEVSAGEVWIPMSVVEDWWFSSGDRRGLDVEDVESLEEGDDVVLCVKKWFLRKEGIV